MLTAECPPLEYERIVDMGELLDVSADDAAAYRECAARHTELSAWARGGG